MGLGLRIASAKQLGLAVAGLLLFAAPAQAACTTGDATPTLTSTGDSAVIGDQAYIVAPSTTGLYFEDDIASTGDAIAVTNGVAIDTTSGSAPGIEIYGEFDTICYDGLASGSIVSSDSGVVVDALSDAEVLLNIAHDITADWMGIVVEHSGDGLVDIKSGDILAEAGGIIITRIGVGNTTIAAGGNITAAAPGSFGIAMLAVGEGTVSVTSDGTIDAQGGGIIVSGTSHEGNIVIKTNDAIDGGSGPAIVASLDPASNGDIGIAAKGNLTSEDSGITVVHGGDKGEVSIATATGTTISAHGGFGPPLSTGPTGIYVERSGSGSSTDPAGDIEIVNGADIDADSAGIVVDVCGCVETGVSITSTGDITADDLGISVLVDGSGDIRINVAGAIVVNGLGISAVSTDLDSTLTIESSADITADTGIAAAGAKIDVYVTDGIIEAVDGIDLMGDEVSLTLGSNARINVTSPLGAGILVDGRSNVEIAGTIDATGTDAILLGGGDATLTLLPGFEIDGLAEACACFDNQLILGGASGDDSFDLDRLGTQFVGFDTYLKTGASIWTLTGDTFTGLLTASGGTVVINDTIAGLDLTLAGGTLKGNGAFDSLTANAGNIAPGNSIGTVTVAGDVAIAGTTVYDVEVNAAGLSDKIEAGGTATLATTASVAVTPEAGTYGAVTQYTILSAVGGVTGTLDPDVDVTSAFFDGALSYDLNNVYLTLTRNSLTLGNFAGTPNQVAAAAALDGAGIGAPYFGELFVLPADEIPGALDAVSGDGYASLTAAGLDDGRFVRDAALDRRGARGIWSTPYGGVAHLPSDGNGPAVDHATGGLLLGADTAMGDGFLGLLLGYGQSRYDIPTRDMNAASNEFSLGTYGGTAWDAFYASFGAAITGRDIDATRRVIFPGVSDSFDADYASLTAQTFAEFGYRLETGGDTAVTPFGGLALLAAATSGYTESGSGAGALTVAPSAATALVATLGLRLEREIALDDERTLTLRGSAAWRLAIGGASTSNSAAGTGTFTVAGAPLPTNTFAVSAGTVLDLGQVSVGADYTGSLSNGGFASAATATLAGTF